MFYTENCRSLSQLHAEVFNHFNVTESQLQSCSSHSMAMCCAVWLALAAPHSHDADGDSPIWFMLYLNLPKLVLIRFRRSSECRARSCSMGLFDGVWMNYTV